MVEDEERLEGELYNAYIFENQIQKIEERLKNFLRLHTNSNMDAGETTENYNKNLWWEPFELEGVYRIFLRIM